MKIRQVIFVFVYTLLQSLNQANCYYNFDGVSNAVRYLNDYTPTPVKNIFLVTSSFLTSEYEFFIEDIHHVIKTIENPKYRVTFITNTKGNISKSFNQIRKQCFSLTVIWDFDNDKDRPKLFLDLLDQEVEDQIWLILLSSNHSNQQEVHNSIHASLSIDSDYKDKFSLMSQVYILARLDGRLQLFEIYRICESQNISLQKISNDPSSESTSKFIWENRKDMQQCPIRVAYMNWFPYLTSMSTDNVLNQKMESLHQTPTTKRLAMESDGLTMNGFSVQPFSILQTRLNFSIKWIPVEDGKFGSFDSSTGEWNGIVRMVQRNNVETSILDLL